MAITFFKDTGTFYLATEHTSYIFRIFDKGYLMSTYWGKKIRPADLTRLWQPMPTGFSPVYSGGADNRFSLDLIPTEYPVYGGGDFRTPAMSARFETGSRLLDLTYRSHVIFDGCALPEGLPGLSGGEQTLEVTLADEFTGLTVVLRYVVYPACDVITRNARVINATGAPVALTRVLSASVDLPDSRWDMISLYGIHCRERQIDRTPLRRGISAVESRRGASSHQHNPFLALAAPETTETAGECYGATLIYSGNFQIGRASCRERVSWTV